MNARRASTARLVRTVGAHDADWIAARYEKLVGLLETLARQLRLSPVAEGIPVEHELTPRRFFADYYFANRPVVLRGLTGHWRARTAWTLDFFADRFGDERVEISGDRNGDPYYEDRFVDHRRELTMAEFIARIAAGAGNDIYLVAKNRLLERSAFASLLDDFDHPAGFLDSTRSQGPPGLWLGGAGTVTPLHHDASNILLAQVLGRKLVRLIPPYEIENVYNDRTCFSAVDIDAPDFASFPRFRDVLVLEAVLQPGDCVFMPIGWWHAVRSLDASISLSFQDFDVPGGPVVWRFYERESRP
jgi:hypothetical protein